MLYRDLAPVSKEAWEEIDETAARVLRSYLSARKVVNVNGPKGLDFNVITEGRLVEVEDDSETDVCYAPYKVQPLVESRIEFEMNRWELDNIQRGAKDVDYEPLEKATEKIALFEDKAIFNGLKNGMIEGLDDSKELKAIPLGDNPNEIMAAITKGIVKLRESYAEGSFSLIVNKDAYNKIISKETSYPLDRRIEDLIEGKIILSYAADGAYLLPYNHEDLELTIGRDFSIGYQSHTNDKVRFFITESFTFRVLDPAIIIKYTVK